MTKFRVKQLQSHICMRKGKGLLKYEEMRKYSIVNPREEYIFLDLHTTSAKQELTAGPANYISQVGGQQLSIKCRVVELRTVQLLAEES